MLDKLVVAKYSCWEFAGSYIIETAQYALNTDIKLQRSTEKYIATVTHRTLLIDYLCQVCYHLTESCHSICLPNTAV